MLKAQERFSVIDREHDVGCFNDCVGLFSFCESKFAHRFTGDNRSEAQAWSNFDADFAQGYDQKRRL